MFGNEKSDARLESRSLAAHRSDGESALSDGEYDLVERGEADAETNSEALASARRALDAELKAHILDSIRDAIVANITAVDVRKGLLMETTFGWSPLANHEIGSGLHSAPISFYAFRASDLVELSPDSMPSADEAIAVLDIVKLSDPYTLVTPVAESFIAEGLVPLVSRKPILFVLGGPGSGKGTQSEMLAHDFRLTHLSAGDLLREEVKSFSEIGKMAESLMKEGKIVPMDVILKLLERAIDSAPDSSRGILIDGFPRALDQAIEFEKTIARAGAIVNFTCPLDVLEQRLLKRGETSGRADDNIETIRKRFDTFQRESLPVLDYFGSRVIHIDGSKSVEDVYDVFSDAILASEIFEPEMNVIFAVGNGTEPDECHMLCTLLADNLNLDLMNFGSMPTPDELEVSDAATVDEAAAAEYDEKDNENEFAHLRTSSQPEYFSQDNGSVDVNLADRLYDAVLSHIQKHPDEGLLIEAQVGWSSLFADKNLEKHALSLFAYSVESFQNEEVHLPEAMGVVEVVEFEPFGDVYAAVKRELCSGSIQLTGNVLFAIGDGQSTVESHSLCSRLADEFQLKLLKFGVNTKPGRGPYPLEPSSLDPLTEEEDEGKVVTNDELENVETSGGGTFFEDAQADLVAEYAAIVSAEVQDSSKRIDFVEEAAVEGESTLDAHARDDDDQVAIHIQKLETILENNRSEISGVNEDVAANLNTLLDQHSLVLKQNEVDAATISEMNLQYCTAQNESAALKVERDMLLVQAVERDRELAEAVAAKEAALGLYQRSLETNGLYQNVLFENEQLKVRLIELQSSAAVAATVNMPLEQSLLAEDKNKVLELERALSGAKGRFQTLLEHLAQKEEELAHTKSERSKEVALHQSEVQAFSIGQENSASMIGLLEQENADARQRHSSLLAAFQTLQAEYSDLLNSHEQLSAETTGWKQRSESEVIRLQSEVNLVLRERNDVVEALEEAEEDLKAAHQRIADLNDVVKIMKSHIAHLMEQGRKNKVPVLEEHVAKLETTITALKAEVQFLKSFLHS